MPIFERRHYQAIAEVLSSRLHIPDSGENKTIENLLALFSKDNPNFSRECFLKACGMEDS